jgi:hypothetical protein
MAFLYTCLGEGGASMTRGAHVESVRILKNHGLERQRGKAAHWVFLEEATVLKRFRAARALAEKLAVAQEAQQQLATGDQNPQALIAFYHAQINMGGARISEIDRQLAALGPSVGNSTADNWHNLLVQERNAIVREQRGLETMIDNITHQAGAFREQRRQFNSDVAGLQDSYRQAVDELRQLVEKILAEYADLAKNTEIAKAVADLSTATHINQKLGPSRELESAAKWLDLARRTGAKRDQRARPRRRR